MRGNWVWLPLALLAFVAGLSVYGLLRPKDEFVHSELCEPAENWLHAVLFILHPICFLSAELIS